MLRSSSEAVMLFEVRDAGVWSRTRWRVAEHPSFLVLAGVVAAHQLKIFTAKLVRMVFPVPGFVEVRIKPELVGMLDEPAVDGRAGLQQAVLVLRLDGLAADV